MGVDIDTRKKKGIRKSPKSNNPYITLLVKLYRFLSRRTSSKFNKIILKRLYMSKVNRPPVSLSSLSKMASKPGNENKTIVVVGSILDDDRFHVVPSMTVCALRFSDKARSKILAAGGSLMTFDLLASKIPDGKNTILMQGKRKAREAVKCFGPAPGSRRSDTKPRIHQKGRKFERARGRRNSRGYKI
ncbi:hypothetical protein MXB_4706 [Myxobolus squamalis]|nr:hypothetical protein MXB_4706 [Myxobolus squamalis]